jgi:hypothetical protein
MPSVLFVGVVVLPRSAAEAWTFGNTHQAPSMSRSEAQGWRWHAHRQWCVIQPKNARTASSDRLERYKRPFWSTENDLPVNLSMRF